MKSAHNSRRLGKPTTPSALQLSVLLGAIAISMTCACATPHAILNFQAPAAVIAGTPFTVTVNVTYQGKSDAIINSAIQFTSSDPAAVLPPNYYFTPADAGSHTWNNGFTLKTPGPQTISGSIYQASGIDGMVEVSVSP